MHADAFYSRRCQHAKMRDGERLARFEEPVADRKIFPGLPDVPAPVPDIPDRDAVAPVVGVLVPDDRVGAPRHRGTCHDARGLTRPDRAG